MPVPLRGLHETLITEAIEAGLGNLKRDLRPERRPLHPAEAADRLALHVGSLLRRALMDVPDGDRATVGARLAGEFVMQIGSALGTEASELEGDLPVDPAQVLRAILALRPDGTPEAIEAPLIPLLDTTLLTNAPGEPRVGKQLQTEIDSADRIDVVMAFIRRSGIRPLLERLRRHTSAGRQLRVLTTSYTGSTEGAALDMLQTLGGDVRVSYDTTTTRLHAKAWLFHRESGFSTAYIGSSNLTHSAQVAGLEWNVRASGARNADVIDKVAAVFESYWQMGEFEPYDKSMFLERTGPRDSGPAVILSPIELRPEPFQERLLEQIALSRARGHHRNLLVSATGTGKTVMAAVDYVRLRDSLPAARLLFVAHRKEILQQSRATFCHALRDHSFGELWVGGARPERFEHVFASIQSLTATGFGDLAPDRFDVVIVDEFHHAAARSYEALLEHVRPRELLGLTATPERSDDLPILHWFDDRIAAELRLWDAIDQHRLTPFLYFGVHDGLDLSDVPWKRGRGYDVEALTGILTANDRWAHLVLKQLDEHVDDVTRMRALGFCVSIEHARFMARVFRKAGVAASAVWGDSPPTERAQSLRDLADRKVQILFSVDLFNEGVDLPTVDTLLLLRPTDSPTLFLQQLGRGLRRAQGKTACTVLDFVGQHRREFRMDRRMRALLGGSRKDLVDHIQRGFPFLPAGCHMELDPKSTEIVLANIKAAIPGSFKQKARELAQVASSRPDQDVTLIDYLDQTGLELEDAYANKRCWSDLRAEANLPVAGPGPAERVLRRACTRLLHIDDPLRLESFQRFVALPSPPFAASLSKHDRRLLRMLVGSIAGQAAAKSDDLDTGTRLLWRHPQVLAELRELFTALHPRVSHLQADLPTSPDVPLKIHARYTRSEIQAAFGVGDGAKITNWQAGVLWAEQARADLFAFTLDKTSGQFSPTTRYRDYAISRTLIHWESQSVTRAESETGRRYQTHAERGSSVMLFARLRADERAFWFLGPATYVSHRSEKPMSITWRLAVALPGDLFASFAAAVA
ncbi:MAG: DUF3427 domain-containing protein [bacterium]|nr:DUF3427 domain-containing protein [bacterium]